MELTKIKIIDATEDFFKKPGSQAEYMPKLTSFTAKISRMGINVEEGHLPEFLKRNPQL